MYAFFVVMVMEVRIECDWLVSNDVGVQTLQLREYHPLCDQSSVVNHSGSLPSWWMTVVGS